MTTFLTEYIKATTGNIDEPPSPIAQYTIGRYYHSGKFVKKCYITAAKYYKLASAQNYAPAQSELGWLYYLSRIRDVASKRVQPAIKYLQLAADQDDITALSRLGHIYEKIDSDKAVEYYQLVLTIDKDRASIFYDLGQLFFFIKKDHSEGIKYFQLAADKGYPSALLKLGIICMNEKSYSKAVDYFQMNLQKFPTNSMSLYYLGYMYKQGYGVEQSYEKAVYYFKRANIPISMGRLAEMYGTGIGVEKSETKYIKYFLKSSSRRSRTNCYFKVGLMYKNGPSKQHRVTQSYKKAAIYFQKAADEGHVNALLELGVMYKNGNWVEQSYEKAVEHFQLASTNIRKSSDYMCPYKVLGEFQLASTNIRKSSDYMCPYKELGEMYRYGYGVEKSEEKYIEYTLLHLSANHSKDAAHYMVGKMFKSGDTVEKSYEKAIKYFELSKTYLGSLCELGEMYRYGYGVEKSYEKAINYYRIVCKGSIQYREYVYDARAAIASIVQSEEFLHQYFQLLDTITIQNSKIQKLETKTKLLKAHIKYMPGGDGYLQAEEDFNMLS